MSAFVLLGAVLGALTAVVVMLLVAFNRKGNVAALDMTRRRMVLFSAAPPQAMYGWLTQYCPAGYHVEDADPASGRFVLSSRPSMTSWGFFFPAVVYADRAGSRVEIGIKSRLFQWGPLVTREHLQLTQALASLTGSQVAEG